MNLHGVASLEKVGSCYNARSRIIAVSSYSHNRVSATPGADKSELSETANRELYSVVFIAVIIAKMPTKKCLFSFLLPDRSGLLCFVWANSDSPAFSSCI